MAKTTNTAKPKAKTDRRKSTKSTTQNPETPRRTVTVSESEIARRAFEVYCARGGQHGRALDDWLQAERELMASNTSATN
jgi:hypothetical protein